MTYLDYDELCILMTLSLSTYDTEIHFTYLLKNYHKIYTDVA